MQEGSSPAQAAISNGDWTLSWSASPSHRASVEGADLQKSLIPSAQHQSPVGQTLVGKSPGGPWWATTVSEQSDYTLPISTNQPASAESEVLDTQASPARSTGQVACEPTLGTRNISPELPINETDDELLSHAFKATEDDRINLSRQSQPPTALFMQHELHDPESHCMSSGSASVRSSTGNSTRHPLSEFDQAVSISERAPRQVRRYLPEEPGDGVREAGQGPWWYVEPGPPSRSTDSEVDEDATGSVHHIASDRSAPTYVRAVLRADHLRSRRAVRLTGTIPRFVENEHARGEQLAKRMQKYTLTPTSPEEQGPNTSQPIGQSIRRMATGTISSSSTCSSTLGSPAGAGSQVTWMM